MKVCYHQGRYGVEIMLESLFRDRTVSWVRIVFAKAKPRSKTTFTLSLVSIPYRERKWIDVETGKYSQCCFEVSKLIIRLFRHDDTVHRQENGAVRFDDLAEKIKAQFEATSHWSIEVVITFLARGGPKKRFQYCLNPNYSEYVLFPSNPRAFRRYSR